MLLTSNLLLFGEILKSNFCPKTILFEDYGRIGLIMPPPLPSNARKALFQRAWACINHKAFIEETCTTKYIMKSVKWERRSCAYKQLKKCGLL